MISIGFVLRLNSLLSRSTILVVRSDIHSSSGQSKEMRHEAIDLSRQAAADGAVISYLLTRKQKKTGTLPIFQR
jgi:hypothetical protein